MQRLDALMVSILALALATPIACGPKCPEIKTAMSAEDMVKDDATRLNKLVDRRKNLITGGDRDTDDFVLERMKFSVTAHELAIQIQMRIINLAEGSELYGKNIDTITDARCFLDEVLERPMNLISDRVGKKIQSTHSLFEKLFDNEGESSKYELRDIYETGIAVDEEDTDEDSDDDFGDDEEADTGEAVKEDKPQKEKESPKKTETKDTGDFDLFD